MNKTNPGRAETWAHHIGRAASSVGDAAFLIRALMEKPMDGLPNKIRAQMAADELESAADSIAIAIGRDMAARIHTADRGGKS